MKWQICVNYLNSRSRNKWCSSSLYTLTREEPRLMIHRLLRVVTSGSRWCLIKLYRRRRLSSGVSSRSIRVSTSFRCRRQIFTPRRRLPRRMIGNWARAIRRGSSSLPVLVWSIAVAWRAIPTAPNRRYRKTMPSITKVSKIPITANANLQMKWNRVKDPRTRPLQTSQNTPQQAPWRN